MDRNKKYYYSHFLNDGEREICDLIIDGLEKRKKNVSISGIASSNASIIKVIDIISLDFPEYFFFDVATTKIWHMGFMHKVEIGYLYSMDEITRIEQVISKKTIAILNSVPKDLSLPDKEKFLHDKLIKCIRYATGDLSIPKLHNIVGPFIDGVAVCEGYAKAFQYLCEQLGILCLVVTGIAESKIDGVKGPHAWNIVRVYGKGCCHVDVTWDSCFYHSGSSHYVYFNQTDQEMLSDHSWDMSKVPKCSTAVDKKIAYCETAKQLEDLICKNILDNKLIFSVRVKKKFSGNEEVLAFTKKIISRHIELMIKQYTVSYIPARNQIEYQFSKF